MTKAAAKTDKARKVALAKAKPAKNGERHRDEILDAALEGTFPASDPVELTPKSPK